MHNNKEFISVKILKLFIFKDVQMNVLINLMNGCFMRMTISLFLLMRFYNCLYSKVFLNLFEGYNVVDGGSP